MRIKFTERYHVLDGTGTHYQPGDELVCTIESAQHFIRRGVAVAVKRAAKKKEVAQAQPVGERNETSEGASE